MKYSAIIVLLAASLLSAQTGPNDARAREIYKVLVEINTTDTPAGNVTKAAEACRGAVEGGRLSRSRHADPRAGSAQRQSGVPLSRDGRCKAAPSARAP
jgi:hypothetical protein